MEVDEDAGTSQSDGSINKSRDKARKTCDLNNDEVISIHFFFVDSYRDTQC